MGRKKKLVSWELVSSMCAWCGKRIAEDSEVFSIGARARPGVDLKREGHVLELEVSPTRTIYAIVPTADSQARMAGWDLLFVICSEACGIALRAMLQDRIDAFDDLLVA